MRELPPRVPEAVVFVASGAVLVVELLGLRLLAPYVGLTLETTTAIIGAVLAGIAAGAALGGRAADTVEPRLLLPILLAARRGARDRDGPARPGARAAAAGRWRLRRRS